MVISGRDAERAAAVAAEIGGDASGIAVDLSGPARIVGASSPAIEAVDQLVLAGIDRDQNTVADYQIDGAVGLVALKLVGYTEVIHQLLPRMPDDAAIVVFGGLAKDRPYPGSTTVSTINGGVVGLVNTLATELPPIRINAVHPGIVGDSPFWADKPLDHITSRTPGGPAGDDGGRRRRGRVPPPQPGGQRRRTSPSTVAGC